MDIDDIPITGFVKLAIGSVLFICCYLMFHSYLFPNYPTRIPSSCGESLLIRVKITKVIDGDSLEFKQIRQTNFSRSINLTEELRLVGIDAYEMTDSRKKYRLLANIQKDITYHYLAGRDILLELEKLPTGQPKRDIYNRLLGYIILENRKIYQEMVLEKGFARGLYTYPFKKEYEDLFRAAEKIGKNCGGGIENFPPEPTMEDNMENLIGEITSIRFQVLQVNESSRNLFMEATAKKLVVIVPKRSIANFFPLQSMADFFQLKDKWITVSGFVSMTGGKPSIRIYFPGQIEVD